jgi:hypothetical protein
LLQASDRSLEQRGFTHLPRIQDITKLTRFEAGIKLFICLTTNIGWIIDPKTATNLVLHPFSPSDA